MDPSRAMDPTYTPLISPQKGTTLFPFCMVCIAISTIFIALRFWSRATLHGLRYSWDDWTALAAWPFVLALLTIVAAYMRRGFGNQITELPLGSIILSLKLLFATMIVYNTAIALIRISTLFFYRRVFDTRSKFLRYNFWAALTANVVWLLGFYFDIIFQCKPITAFWQRAVLEPGTYHCLDVFPAQIASATTSVFLDLWILLIPLPILWKLQLPLARKALLIGIFFMGYCVIIFTIGRLVAVLRAGNAISTNITWAFVTPIYWHLCEITIGFVAICLPSLVHLLKRGRSYGLNSLFNNHEYDSQSSKRQLFSKYKDSNGTHRADDFQLLSTASHTNASKEHSEMDMDIEPGTIKQTLEFSMTEGKR